MALILKSVEAARGARWVGDAWRVFRKKPLPFTGLAALVLVIAQMSSLWLPLALGVGLLAPLLVGLGFMIAGQSALLDGPVRARSFIEPLRTDATRRRSLLLLCVSYGTLVMGVFALGSLISGEAWERVAQALQMDQGEASQAALVDALSASGVTSGIVTIFGLWSTIALVFWHAPALVHWGGQSPGQALFSSTLAVWRNRGAFLVYVLTLLASGMAVMLLATLLAALLGGVPSLVVMVGLLAMAVSVAVYNLSLLFCFNDCFGGAPVQVEQAEAAEPKPPADDAA